MFKARKSLVLLVSIIISSVTSLSILSTAQSKELKFITLETAPWASFDPETGNPVGAFPAIVKELGKRSKHKISMSLRPFARINQDLTTGDQDCTIILWNDSRASIVERGASVYNMSFGVIARNGIELKTYDDLSPLTISMIRGLKIDPKFDNDENLNRDFDKSYQIGLRKIAHNRLNAIAGAIPTIFYMAEKDQQKDLLGDFIVMKEIPITLQCSKHSDKLDVMPELNNVIEEMRLDGSLKRLMAENFYF